MNAIQAWVNGALVSADSPSISAVDHGVTVGDGAFETAKIEDGEPFAVNRHLERLDNTMRGLGLPPADHDVLWAGIGAVLGAGETIDFGRLRWTVTGGRGPLGSDRLGSDLTYIVTAARQARPAGPASIITVPWIRNERAATAGLKTTSYAENVIALAHAQSHGATEAIFANSVGQLCEGTGSNIFVVRAGTIATPTLASGALGGISRALVLEWARDDGLPIDEVDLPIAALADADEVFLTSSIKDVMPVGTADGRTLPAPGPVTARMMEIWKARSAQTREP